MNNRERILAVLEGKKPDRIPFLPFSELIPDNPFRDELIARGMGMIVHAFSFWPEIPDVAVTKTKSGGNFIRTYHTPYGDVSTTNSSCDGSEAHEYSPQTEFLIKGVKDYDAAIYIIDNTVYRRLEDEFHKSDKDIGDNGITHLWTSEPAYMEAQYFLGLEKWSYEQEDNPGEFERLTDALEKRMDRLLLKLLNGPEKHLINLGNLAGNFSPAKYEEHILPFYKKYVPMFKERGKICTIHADAFNLKEHKELLRETGIDVVEAFTPPPVGNLSLEEARKAWGEKVTIWINFPEAIFYEGYEKTKKFTTELLKSDTCPNKFLGMTEMGLQGVRDLSQLEMFQTGMRAIMDALDEAGTY